MQLFAQCITWIKMPLSHTFDVTKDLFMWAIREVSTFILKWSLCLILFFFVITNFAVIITFFTGLQQPLPTCPEGYILRLGTGCIPNNTEILVPGG
jgi:hypothetical protein